MNATSDGIYTASDVSDLFDVHINTVYRWIHSGILSASRVGHRFYITSRALNEALLPHRPKEIHNGNTYSHT